MEIAPELVDCRLEALIFVSAEPLSAQRLAEVLKLDEGEVEAGLERLGQRLDAQSALCLTQVGGGFRLETRPDYVEDVEALLTDLRQSRLSVAALETLALIAYRQPITAVEISQARQVTKVSSVLKGLLDRKLIKMLGRKKVVGRPMMYGTTREFLIQFGLNSLRDLPSLEEFAAAYGDHDDEDAISTLQNPSKEAQK